MADKNDKSKPTIALPKVDEITSVAVTDLPAAPTRATLSDDEIALANAIIAATTGDNAGHVAVGPKLADRKTATTAAARIKRLVNALFASKGVATDARPAIATRTVPKDGGFAWGVTITPKAADAEAATDAAAE